MQGAPAKRFCPTELALSHIDVRERSQNFAEVLMISANDFLAHGQSSQKELFCFAVSALQEVEMGKIVEDDCDPQVIESGPLCCSVGLQENATGIDVISVREGMAAVGYQ
jgi:hypothetical protein